MNYKSYVYSLFGLAVCGFLLFPLSGRAAVNPGGLVGDDPTASSTTQTSIVADDDAIAVRVLPNPNHYSAARWYKSQGFSGSLQSLLVDGYDAVRDGRTVYVNAANVDVNNKLIYTNIYLISYNQNPDFKTIDVLGQIVSHWRFNSNLGAAGMCTISTLPCWSASDCVDGMTCFGKSAAPGRCVPAETVDCYTDAECPQGIYCDSLRSKFARDVRRLGMLGDLRESLATYKKQNNKYPILGAGTYLPLSSVSVWPSWQTLLLSQLGASQSLVDPINTLGPCANHDVKTCWNEDTNSFADPITTNTTLELPGGSYAFVYSGDKNGSNYNLCGAMETKSLGYNTTEGQLASAGCVSGGSGYVGSTNNLAPILIATNLQGEPDDAFNGYIKVIDPEGNPLSWTINTGGITWTNWKNNNQNNVAPILQDTTNPNQKKVYAQGAGNAGTYNLAINVSDGSTSLATITPIRITNKVPNIQSEDVVYYPSVNIPLIVRFSITEKHYPVTFTFAKATYNSGPYDVLAASTVVADSKRVGDTTTYTRKYTINTSNKFTRDTTFTYVVTARDRFNVSSTRQINITIKADPPILDFNCSKSVRVGSAYYCNLGLPNQGDHTVTYSAVGALPPGLSIGLSGGALGGGAIVPPQVRSKTLRRLASWINNSWQKIVFGAEAAVPSSSYSLFGTPTTASSSYLIKLKAENEFGAFSEREFNLRVNNYCGDGLRQTPNLEGRGGFYNDGLEDCDGNAGVAVNRSQIGSSSPSLQYGCTTKVGTVVPNPITNNMNVCVFSSPLEETGGGYCGDGICQYKITRNGVNIPWEAGGYCPKDCTCAGANQSMVAGECACNTGWFDCDSQVSGCESNTACPTGTGACLPTQYSCGGTCVSRSNMLNCGTNKAVCYKYPSTPPNICNTACESGYYNCDGLYECENTMCACPVGQHWDGAAWPNAKCVVNYVDPCPGSPLPCGNTCYNPATQTCCAGGVAPVICSKTQWCCSTGNSFTCTPNAAHCNTEYQTD